MPDEQPLRKELHEQNRKSWNLATQAHNSHKGDQASYYRQGGNKLYPEELELLGDIRGLDVVHLQCNSGQDSLSLANLGARVTGVDISDEAIGFARLLSTEAGVPATFVRSDVYDWFDETTAGGQRFDIAFSSYGAVCWLSDLDRWARGIAAILRPGGRFVIVDYHPAMSIFEEDWSLHYPYFGGGEPHTWMDGVGDYVAQTGESVTGYEPGVVDFANPEPVHEFFWPVGDIITALLRAGLSVEAFREYPYCNGFKPFPDMIRAPGHPRAWIPPAGRPAVPFMYAIAARAGGVDGTEPPTDVSGR